MRRPYYLAILLMALAPTGMVTAGWPPELIEVELGIPSTVEDGVEVRVWLGGVTRVADVFRIVKRGKEVSVDQIKWAEIAHADTYRNEKEARRETSYNRRLLEKEHCVGKIVETPNYLWCRKAVRSEGPWPVVFDDLLPDELWNLPTQVRKSCGRWVILDGEAVAIDILEQGRRHSVSYWNPDICCGTVACAIVNHVRSVVRDNIF